jgi:hypothetical protein
LGHPNEFVCSPPCKIALISGVWKAQGSEFRFGISRKSHGQNGGEFVKKILLVTLLLTLCSITVFAADSRAHSPQAAVTNRPSVLNPLVPPWHGLKKIYSNLGSSTDAYDSANGWFVSGIDNIVNAQKQDIALPFTPKRNATIMEVGMALQYYGSGFNGAVAAIYDDASGLPGKALAKKDLKNFRNFGDGCCKLALWNLTKGVKVQKGKQYWVVGTTDKKSMDSINTWDWVFDDHPDNFAFQQDDGGWILYNGTLPAGAVYGTIP